MLNRSASRGSTQEETVADYFVHHGLIAVLPIRLQRALSRYGILTRRERWLSETARRVGLHRSTAHHLMQMLMSAGHLRQEKTTCGYELKRLAQFYAYENSVYASLA